MYSRNDGVLQQTIPDARRVVRYINVDSRDRDRTIYPDTNDYEVAMKTPLFGVQKLQLVSAEIPKSEYFIDETNNTIEVVFDPAAFWSSAPSETSGDTRVVHIAPDTFMIARVHTSFDSRPGVLFYVTRSAIRTVITPVSVFNVARTAHVDVVRMHASDAECICVATYTESDVGACRVVITRRYDSPLPSFGSQFAFDTNVESKRLVALDSRRFAIGYRSNGAGVVVRVGSTGVDVDDVATRLTNARAYSRAVEVVAEHAMARVDAERFVVVYVTKSGLVNYGVHICVARTDAETHLTTTGVVQTIKTAPVKIASVSCASQVSGRTIIAWVEAPNICQVTIAQVYDMSVAVHGSSTITSEIDPLARAIWLSDASESFIVDIETSGDVLINGVAGTPLSLLCNERYRFTVRKGIGTELVFYASEHGNERHWVYASDLVSGTAESIVVDSPSNPAILFYGTASGIARGRIVVSTPGPTNTVESAFIVCATGQHDVGNISFAWGTDSLADDERSFRRDAPRPGKVGMHAAAAYSRGVAYVLSHDGSLWSHDGARWTLCTPAPFERYGASLAVHADVLYVVGGRGRVFTEPVVEHERVIIQQGIGANSIMAHRFRSAARRAGAPPPRHFFFYYLRADIIDHSGSVVETARLLFHSARDPSDVDSVNDWTGATDLSSEFPGLGAIHGMRLTADNPSTLTYAVPTSRLRALSGGATAVVNPAPGSSIGLGGFVRGSVNAYTFSFMAHVVLSSIESSGVLGSLLTDGVTLRIAARVADNVVVNERSVTVRTGEWTVIALELRDFAGDGTSAGAVMDSLRITIEAPAILLCTGCVGVRDVQFLANVAKIEIPGEVDVRVEFGAFDEAPASGMTNVFVESEFARPDVARHVTTIRVGGHDVSESYLNDVWTLSTDARHGSYDAIVRRNSVANSAGRFDVWNASLNTRGDVDAFVDSSARFVLSRSEASDAQYDSFNGLSALAWPALDDVTGSGGEAAVLFDDVESIRFGGLTAIAMPGTGSRLRSVAEGDFAFATSLCPALSFCVILVDCRSPNAMLAGASGGLLAPSSVRSAEISNLHPTHYNLGLARTRAPFVSGNSMRMTATTHVQYSDDVSGAVAAHTFAAMAYVNASSGSAGERTLLAFPGFVSLVLAADWTLRLKRAADGAEYASAKSIASDVWVHISLTASGNTVHVDVNGDRVMDAFASRPQNSFGFHIGSATSLWSGAIVLNSISVHCMSSFGDASALIARHRSGTANVTDQCVMFVPMSGGELAVYLRSPRSGGTAWSMDGIVGTHSVSVQVPAALLRSSVDVEFTRSNGEVCMCVRDAIGSEIASARAANTTSLKLVSGDMTLGAARHLQPGGGFYTREPMSSVYYASFAGALDEVRLICGEAHVWTSRDVVGSERRRSMTWRREVVRTAVAEPRWEARAFAACTSTAAGVWIYGGKSLCGSCSDHWIAKPALSKPEAGESGSSSWPPPRAVLLTHMSGSPVGAAASTSDHPGAREYASMASADDDIYIFGGEVRQHTGPFVIWGTVRRVRLVHGPAEPDDAEFDASPPSGYIYPVYTARHSVLHDHPAVEWIDIEVSGGVTYTVYAEEGVGANVDSRSNPNLTTFDASLHLLEGDSVASRDLWSDQAAHEPVVTAVYTDLWRYETGPGLWTLVDAGTTTLPGRVSRGSIAVVGGAVRLIGGRIVNSMPAASVESARAAWNETRFLSANVFTDRVSVWTYGAPAGWTLDGVADSKVRYPDRAAAAPYASGLCSPGGSGGRLCAWPVELTGGLRRVAVLSWSGTVFINQFKGASVEVNAHYAIVVHGNAIWHADDSQPPLLSLGARDTVVAEPVRVGALRAIPVPGVGTGTVAVVCNDDIVLGLTIATSDVAARSAAVPQFDTVSGVTTIDVSELSNGSVGLNGQAIVLLRAVWGVVYVFRCGAGLQMDAVVNGAVVASCVPGGSAVVTTTDLGIVGEYDVNMRVRRNDGSTMMPSPVLRVLPIGTVAALASEVAEATSALRVTRVLKSHRASIRSAIPGSAPELVDMCIVSVSPPSGFSMGMVFCDASRARVGTVWFIRSDGSRIFATSGPHDVVPSGPTSNLAIAPISSGLCVATWTASSGAGLHASIVAESSGAGSVLEVTSATVSVPLIVQSRDGAWTLAFVFDGTGRVLAQRAVDGSLAQTLLGDSILYTDSALILSGYGSGVDVAVFASGIRRGDVICVADVDGDLMYQDVGTRDIDPLLSKAAPDMRTVTFSLLERTGFVTSDYADYRVAVCDDIVDGLSGSAVSSFVVVFCTSARDAVRCRMFSFESGAYVGDGAVTISAGTGVRLRDVTMSGRGRMVVSWSSAGTHVLATVDVRTLPGSTSGVARVLSTSVVDVDIASPVLEMPGVFYTPGASPGAFGATHAVFIPVHSSPTNEVGVVAVRGIGSVDAMVVTRSSTTTRVRAGDYSAIGDFRSELERALRAGVDAAFSVSYDSGTTKLSISNSHAAFTGVLDADGLFPRSTTMASNNGLGYIMGFRDFTDFVGRALDDGSFVAEAPARVDMSGRQYIYMYLSNTTEYFSSEVTSRSARNAFGRIVLAVDKGETMFFMEGAHYVIEADVDVPVLTSLRVQLGRFAQLTSASLQADADRSISLYAPQGVEHSFCLRVTCRADKSGSGIAQSLPFQLPDFMTARRLDAEALSDDDGLSDTDSEE